jgi:hypothetical protein
MPPSPDALITALSNLATVRSPAVRTRGATPQD